MQRDGEVEGDDTVSIVLDTYGDKRTGYFFKTNVAVARIDGLISSSEEPSLDWDGIWDVRTFRSAQGWSAEIEIPARTLNFTVGLQNWGLNLERYVSRDLVTLRWASPTLDSGIADLSRAGDLGGLEGLQQGKGLEFNPYAIGKVTRNFEQSDRDWHGTGGFDFTWHVTPQLATVFTVNTDFAETEVDARQINLTRFPLFFPEKRAFFLEGSNQFAFALLGMGGKQGASFIPFFSRRIGLLEGQQIPIDVGAKVNGRVGRLNIGVLDVETRDSDYAPRTNLFAGRFSYDLTPKFRVGTLITNGNPTGLANNTLTGFDAVWRSSEFLGSKNLAVGGYTVFSSGDIPPGDRSGWGFKIDYPNDLFDGHLTLDHFGEALDPALGFLPRPGTQQINGGLAFQPRPARDGDFSWIRQLFFKGMYERVDNWAGYNESWAVNLTPLEAERNSGERFSFNYTPQHEFLASPFEISEDVVIPIGGYDFSRYGFEFETSEHRSWQFDIEGSFGDFYDGDLSQYAARGNWTSAKGRWSLGLKTGQNFAHLAGGNFVQRLMEPQFVFAWSANLVFTSIVQYDTESQNLGLNARLRWTIKPGKDLFVVWNRAWERLQDRPDLNFAPDEEVFAIKLRWTFRF